MNSNTHSARTAAAPAALVGADGLAALAAAVDALAAEDLDGLADGVVAERVLELHALVTRLQGQWLRTLAVVDSRGAAGADQDQLAPSTAGWLRGRLRLSAGAASSWVRTARALFRGPLTGTAQALAAGELSVAHAQVLAHGVHELPAQVAAEAEPVLLAVAGRLDPPRLRRAVTQLRWLLDPEGADALAERQQQQRRLWLSPTWEGMVAVDGLLAPEAGQTLLAALEPLARPAGAGDARSGSQRNADALAELCRRQLEGGRLPRGGGVRPQLLVTVDLGSLLGGHGAPGLGGDTGWAGPLGPEACRRLACDGAVTRVLVTHHPTHHPPPGDHPGHNPTSHPDPDGSGPDGGLAARLRAAAALLPPPSAAPPASRWRWAVPAGWSPLPNAPPWWSATAAV